MKTTHKGYTISAEAEKHESGTWTAVMSISNEDDELVIAPVKLDPEVTFPSETTAEDAAVLVAKYWIDGAAAESEPGA